MVAGVAVVAVVEAKPLQTMWSLGVVAGAEASRETLLEALVQYLSLLTAP